MTEVEKEFNAAIIEESLKEKYPDIDPVDVAKLQALCEDPWDALGLYGFMLILRDNQK